MPELLVWLKLLHLPGFCPWKRGASAFAVCFNPWRYLCSQDVGAWVSKDEAALHKIWF